MSNIILPLSCGLLYQLHQLDPTPIHHNHQHHISKFAKASQHSLSILDLPPISNKGSEQWSTSDEQLVGFHLRSRNRAIITPPALTLPKFAGAFKLTLIVPL